MGGRGSPHYAVVSLMCFSATASFAVAAATAGIGLATVRQVRNPRELPLALVPILFAAQQTVEGIVWLRFAGESGGAGQTGLSFVYLIFAFVFWPAFTAMAVLAVEPARWRRRLLLSIAIVGVFIAARNFLDLLDMRPFAEVRGHSIVYASRVDPFSWHLLVYLVCTSGALLLSSHRMIWLFGAVVALGFAVSGYAYYVSFVSVWCFFAAADSTLLYFHFRRASAALQASPRRRSRLFDR